jgi:phosphohistidine swiveling domain-containing protein
MSARGDHGTSGRRPPEFSFRDGVWFNWQQPASPLLLGGTVDACGEPFREFFGFPFFTSIVFFRTLDQGRGYQASWLLRIDEGEACGRLLVDALSVPSFRAHLDEEIDHSFGALRKMVEEVSSADLGSLADDELIERFEELQRRFIAFYRIGAITEPVQWHVERGFRTFVQETGAAGKAFANGWSNDRIEAAAFMTTDEPYTLEIERSLAAVAAIWGDSATDDINFQRMTAEAWQQLWSRSPALLEAATAHATEYFWKTNNYRETKVVDPADVVRVVAGMGNDGMRMAALTAAIGETEQRRNAMAEDRAVLISRCPATMRTLLDIGDSYGSGLADRRKATMLRALHGIDLLGREVARRAGEDYELVLYLTPNEVRQFAEDPIAYRLRLEQRQEALVLVQSPFPLDDAEMAARLRIQAGESDTGLPRKDDVSIAEGDISLELLLRLDATMGLFEDGPADAVSGSVIVKPSGASPVVEGRCRVITDPRADRLEPGEILIATSTTPDFMPAIRNAAALLVDQGGVLSHAALTSRELGKPCIVGVSHATSIFRSGDLIRLNFEEGSATLVDGGRGNGG